MSHPDRNQEATVYIGNLDERITEALVWELMLQAGPVKNVHLPKDRVTQQHQNYGFCEYLTAQDAEYAVKIMNAVRLFGKPIRVNMASSDPKGSDVGANLFVGNLDVDTDEATLRETFGRFGSIVSAHISHDSETGENRGFAFVSFSGFEESDAAIEGMDGQYLNNKQINVSYSFKKDSKTERHGSQAERLLAAEAKKNNVQTYMPLQNSAMQPYPMQQPGYEMQQAGYDANPYGAYYYPPQFGQQ